MTDVQKNNYDVAIVGAGPAGSSLAIRLAQTGLKVLLVEQKKFPRGKLCGEFISPECLVHFAELNVLDQMSLAGGVPLERTVFYARNARSVTVPSEWFTAGCSALGLSRAEMDAQLLIRARTAGADILEETQAVGLLFDGEKVCGIKLRNKDRNTANVRAALSIDATGRARALARLIEKAHNTGKRERARFVAFKTHVEGASIPHGDCEIYAYRGGYGGSSRVEKGLYNLCFIISADIAKKYGSDASEIMKHAVFENHRAKSSLGDSRIVEDWLAVPIESYGRAGLAPSDGLLSVGDAAAFIDPFTGSGILLALESSKIAAAAIAQEFLKSKTERHFAALAFDYQKHYAAAFDKRLRVCSLLRHAAFVPFFAEAVINGLAFSSRLTRRLARATRPAANSA